MQSLSASSLAVRSNALANGAAPDPRGLDSHPAIPQSGPTGRARILSIGNDSALTSSRQLVFQSVGHRVVSLSSAAALSKEFLESFDLAVLCHSIKPRDQMVQAIRLLRPDLPLLLVGEICCDAPRGGEIYVSPKPEILLAVISNIMNAQPSADRS